MRWFTIITFNYLISRSPSIIYLFLLILSYWIINLLLGLVLFLPPLLSFLSFNLLYSSFYIHVLFTYIFFFISIYTSFISALNL